MEYLGDELKRGLELAKADLQVVKVVCMRGSQAQTGHRQTDSGQAGTVVIIKWQSELSRA